VLLKSQGGSTGGEGGSGGLNAGSITDIGVVVTHPFGSEQVKAGGGPNSPNQNNNNNSGGGGGPTNPTTNPPSEVALTDLSPEELRRRVIALETEYQAERGRTMALEEEAKRPLNVHRWMKLETTDPDKMVTH
jgi:hypothetical protein